MEKQSLCRVIISGIMLGAIAACAPDAPSNPSPDASERPSTDLPGENPAQRDIPQRIVALSSISADLVETLSDEKLVGIPGSPLLASDPRFEGLEVISQGRTEPDLEKIIALEPELVIGAEGFHDKALQRLSDLDIETLPVDIDSWDSLRAVTQQLAEQLGSDSAPVLQRYESCLEQAPERAATAVLLVSREPLLSPNQNSWASDFITQFNLQNLTADLQGQSEFEGYVTLSPEKVLELNPDRVLLIETGEGAQPSELQAEPFWRELKAVQTDQIETFDYFGLINPGSLASIEKVCNQLGRLG
ncbi:MAG: ABC transporter substrate-binding protein [Cyanobacteria bacterium P01_G01_bin.38]